MKRFISLISLAAVAGCAAGRYEARPVTNEAANLFARADSMGFGASLMLDVETLRELGFVPPPPVDGEPAQPSLGNALVALLPAMIGFADKEEEKGALARLAVYARVVERWNAWPHTQRFGILVPAPSGKLDANSVLDNAVILVAVDADEVSNRQVLEGFAALNRSYSSGTSPNPNALEASLEKGRLCVQNDKIPAPLCLHGGGGYYALGTGKALAAALASASGPAPTVDPTLPPDVLRVRMALANLGTGSLRLSGRDSLKLEVRVDDAQPQLVAKAEQELNKLLARWDDSRKATATLVATELEQAKAALAADASAPLELKTAAQTTTVSDVVDPDGQMEAIRNSIKIERGAKSLLVEVTVPESQVKTAATQFGGTAAISVAGIMAAIAIPNFIKYQCRAKQSEVRANLRALATAQMAFAQERSAWGSSFAELGFMPEPGTRYTYCMAGQCLPCSHEGCQIEGPNPCSIYEAGAGDFIGCAFANLSGDGDKLDVWLVNSSLLPENVSNDCSN